MPKLKPKSWKKSRAWYRQGASEGEALLALQLRAEHIPFEREVAVVPGRKYRWDFRIGPTLLVEVQGGVWNVGGSAHATGRGITRDAEKASLAVANGFREIIATTEQVRSGQALDWIRQALEAGNGKY